MKNNIRFLFREPYHIINLIFAGIIILIIIYSGIFSAEKGNHPIKSACAKVEGHPCKSEGLSRAFSEIVRFRFKSAKSYNKYSIRIFSFFLIQLFLRIGISFILYFKKIQFKKMVFADSMVSIVLYFYCFWGLIV